MIVSNTTNRTFIMKLFPLLLTGALLGISAPALADCGGGNGNQDPPANGCDGGETGGTSVVYLNDNSGNNRGNTYQNDNSRDNRNQGNDYSTDNRNQGNNYGTINRGTNAGGGDITAEGGAGGRGGRGGDGGAGGTGIGVGIGQGGAGGSAEQSQGQGQQQGQGQSQSSSNRNRNSVQGGNQRQSVNGSGNSENSNRSSSSSNSESRSNANNNGNAQNTTVNTGGNTSIEYGDLPETAVAPLPGSGAPGQIGDIVVPLPTIGVGGFVSGSEYGDIYGDGFDNNRNDYGVSIGINIPLGAGEFRDAARREIARRDARAQEQADRAQFRLIQEAVFLRDRGILSEEAHPRHYAALYGTAQKFVF